MAQPEVIEQIRRLILTEQTDVVDARKTALSLLNINGLLTGRLRGKQVWENAVMAAVDAKLSGVKLDPTSNLNFTKMPRAILADEALMSERLNLTPEELPKARVVFNAMIVDLEG